MQPGSRKSPATYLPASQPEMATCQPSHVSHHRTNVIFNMGGVRGSRYSSNRRWAPQAMAAPANVDTPRPHRTPLTDSI
jgi:hypothetical protein